MFPRGHRFDRQHRRTARRTSLPISEHVVQTDAIHHEHERQRAHHDYAHPQRHYPSLLSQSVTHDPRPATVRRTSLSRIPCPVPNYLTFAQESPRQMYATIDLETGNMLAIFLVLSPIKCSRRISRTSSSVSFARPLRSPAGLPPFLILSRMLFARVSHRRFESRSSVFTSLA